MRTSHRISSARLLPALSLLAASLGGCTSAKTAAFDPSAESVVYYVSQNDQTVREERLYTTTRGDDLGFIVHTSTTGKSDTALVYLHGIESHAGWFDEAADRLCARGYDVYCLDRRGSGINRENRGFPTGHVDSYITLFADIDAFTMPLRNDYEAVYLIGLSWGGKLGLAYSLTSPERCDGVVLITPGLRSIVDVNLFAKLGIFTGSAINPTAYFATPIEAQMFTNTPQLVEMIRADPLKLHYATARFFMVSRRLEGYIDELMPSNQVPILLFLAGQDTIIDNQAVLEVLEVGAGNRFDVITYDDQTHSVQFDAPDRLVDDMDEWLKKQRESAAPRVD